MNDFHVKKKSQVFSSIPFSVEEVWFKTKNIEPDHPHYRLNCPDWVNVLPILSDGRAALIRQPRVGTESYLLETPGGVVEPSEKDFTMSALRELEEETGLTTKKIIPLASLNPNPAIMDNRCHFFLALACEPSQNRARFPDRFEEIALELYPVEELQQMVRIGQINHALAALSIMLSFRYLSANSNP
jgi:ADP-ribose pyrophosphatase